LTFLLLASNTTFCTYFERFIATKSIQVTFIYIALYTIQFVSKQLYSNNMKIIQHSLFLEENCGNVHLK